jgi:hypothetical protein
MFAAVGLFQVKLFRCTRHNYTQVVTHFFRHVSVSIETIIRYKLMLTGSWYTARFYDPQSFVENVKLTRLKFNVRIGW